MSNPLAGYRLGSPSVMFHCLIFWPSWLCCEGHARLRGGTLEHREGIKIFANLGKIFLRLNTTDYIQLFRTEEQEFKLDSCSRLITLFLLNSYLYLSH